MRNFVSLAIFATSIHGIVYREDISVSNYRISPDEYPMTFKYNNYPDYVDDYNCAATMIGPRHAITAAHCFDDGLGPFDITVAGNRYRVIETRLNNCFSFKNDGPNSADMAILVLDKPITTEYVEVYNAERSGSEVGKEFTLIGWGAYGTIGSSPRSLRDNVFHRGMNVFT